MITLPSLMPTPLGFTLRAIALGLVLGSFINVVIHRLPIMLKSRWHRDCSEYLADCDVQAPWLTIEPPYNLLTPPSTCPGCGHRIRAWENIPLISYAYLRGRCAQCRSTISLRYPLIELLCALLAGLIAYRYGYSSQSLLWIALSWTLVTLSWIDLNEQLLPDSLTLPLLWAGLLASSLQWIDTDSQQSIWGAATGYLFFWSIYWLFKLLRNKEGMGYGDFKLLAALGAWFGLQALPAIVFIASLTGALAGLIMMRWYQHPSAKPIAFGPYLCLAALLYLFVGDPLLPWY